MCCKIDLNCSKDAAHFLGKGEPKLLPKLTQDNLPSSQTQYTGAPAMSVFDHLKLFFSQKF